MSKKVFNKIFLMMICIFVINCVLFATPLKDGMYIWEYEDKDDGDFEGWPMIVEAETLGSIQN